MEQVIATIIDNGVTVGIIIYFVWRDLKYMNKLEESLAVLQKTVELFLKQFKE